MTQREQDGWVVITLGSDGSPRGNALWCADGDEVERVMREEREWYGHESTYLSLWRPIAVPTAGPRHREK